MPKYHVQRSIEIDAPRSKVFDTVVDYSTWTTWSPWLIAEPQAKVDVSSDSCSVGSTYEWDGSVVGAGRLTHQKIEQGRFIDDEIAFFRPFRSVNRVTFEFADVGSGTRVTWNMYASLPIFLFWMTGMMKGMISMDYDRGLKMLKSLIETGSIPGVIDIKGQESVDAVRIVGARRTCVLSEISTYMEDALDQATTEMTVAGIPTSDSMAAVYHSLNMKTQVMEFSAGYLVSDSAPAAPASLTDWKAPAGNAFGVRHTGAYEFLGNAWSVANQHVRYKKLKQAKCGAYEVYRNSPKTTAPADLITDVYLPLR